MKGIFKMKKQKTAPKRNLKNMKTTKKSSKSKKQGNLFVRWAESHRKLVTLFAIVIFSAMGTYIIVASRAATSTNINMWDKATVNYQYHYLWESGAKVTTGWTGSVSGCNRGNISDAARRAQINGINFARRINNLSPISGIFNDTNDASINTQKTALMMTANNAVSHYPTTSWRCYTAAGDATAAKSNLALATPSLLPLQAVKLFLDDPGSGNGAVGHRRWLLNPPALRFGFGMTNNASAIQVIDLATDSTANNPLWTMWPSRGYFPTPLEPGGRWSISTHNTVNLSKATVSVTHNNVAVPVTRYAVESGYGRPTLVWQMPANFEKVGNYYVTISNAYKDGAKMSPYTYPVYFFAPY